MDRDRSLDKVIFIFTDGTTMVAEDMEARKYQDYVITLEEEIKEQPYKDNPVKWSKINSIKEL